jgi:hypothetical protein
VSNKKYQIFISSTFSDLVEERQLALKAILDLDHIPSGMEAFPAIDIEQFEYIKKVIDECDYYLLIVGARYGSTDSEGVSYTEREFDYARSVGKTVIALLHNDIKSLPMKNFDADATLLAKLEAFREKVKTGRMIRYWANRDQLIAGMMQAIVKAISTYPATGWIRGDTAASNEIMQQLVQLRSAYDELLSTYNDLISVESAQIEGLASLKDSFAIRYSYVRNGSRYSNVLTVEWKETFKIIGPNLYSPSGPSVININLRRYIQERNTNMSYISVNEMDADTIKMHLATLGLIKIDTAVAKGGGVSEFVSMAEKGKAELLNTMAVRRSEDSQ